MENGIQKAPVMAIALPDAVKKVEFNGIVSATEADKKLAIATYLVNKALRNFGVQEVEKTPVQGGGIYFNEGNKQRLKLSAVKRAPNGSFAETPLEYISRHSKEIDLWLLESAQMSTFQRKDVLDMFAQLGVAPKA